MRRGTRTQDKPRRETCSEIPECSSQSFGESTSALQATSRVICYGARGIVGASLALKHKAYFNGAKERASNEIGGGFLMPRVPTKRDSGASHVARWSRDDFDCWQLVSLTATSRLDPKRRRSRHGGTPYCDPSAPFTGQVCVGGMYNCTERLAGDLRARGSLPQQAVGTQPAPPSPPPARAELR